MFGSLDTSTSALVANRQRMEIISANMANRESLEDADGNYSPFRRRFAVFAQGDPSTGNPNGVHVKEVVVDSDTPLRRVWEPGSKFADADGYVAYPNVTPEYELINALEASRSYEANITAAEATKAMLRSSLRLLA